MVITFTAVLVAMLVLIRPLQKKSVFFGLFWVGNRRRLLYRNVFFQGNAVCL